MAAVISAAKNRGHKQNSAIIDEIICSISHSTNQINKAASALEYGINKQSYALVESNFEEWNEAALSLQPQSDNGSSVHGYAEPEKEGRIVDAILHRLFGGIDFLKFLLMFSLSVTTFFLAFSLLTSINPEISAGSFLIISFKATLEFANLIIVISICAFSINALIREAHLPGRNNFQKTMFLTAALLLSYETWIVVMMGLSI